MGEKNVMPFVDEQVTVFDCMDRLKNFDYVAIIDVDEIVVPRRIEPLLNYKMMMVGTPVMNKII